MLFFGPDDNINANVMAYEGAVRCESSTDRPTGDISESILLCLQEAS